MSRQWPGPTEGEVNSNLEKTQALDVLLIVARHILLTHTKDIPVNTTPNPILELARKDFESDQYKANSIALKEGIIDAVGSPDWSFASLCESSIMHETLWGLPSFLLFRSLEILVKDTDGKEQWAPDALPDPSFLAATGLITWDGDSDLVDCMTRLGWSRRFRDGTIRRLSLCEKAPVLIRVRYRPTPGCQRTEKDLLGFRDPGGQHYTLLAAVWLRGDKTTETNNQDAECLDLVQLYSMDTADLLPATANKYRSPYPEKVGQEGRTYMLFYGACEEPHKWKSRARCLYEETSRLKHQHMKMPAFSLEENFDDIAKLGQNVEKDIDCARAGSPAHSRALSSGVGPGGFVSQETTSSGRSDGGTQAAGPGNRGPPRNALGRPGGGFSGDRDSSRGRNRGRNNYRQASENHMNFEGRRNAENRDHGSYDRSRPDRYNSGFDRSFGGHESERRSSRDNNGFDRSIGGHERERRSSRDNNGFDRSIGGHERERRSSRDNNGIGRSFGDHERDSDRNRHPRDDDVFDGRYTSDFNLPSGPRHAH
ncbi:hypothetical protein CH35J_005799 [Colletotrichum higginsianum]|uniref:Uncharacterized protein n=1 Tax=Colletotrichum higginsianum TaxID=80884 RepID=A0A4T0W552_9PEZI|nr:hypothetical protein CH35J_005799 [Colletotrichum higginsianum]